MWSPVMDFISRPLSGPVWAGILVYGEDRLEAGLVN